MVLLLELKSDDIPYVCRDVRRREEQLVGASDDNDVFAWAECRRARRRRAGGCRRRCGKGGDEPGRCSGLSVRYRRDGGRYRDSRRRGRRRLCVHRGRRRRSGSLSWNRRNDAGGGLRGTIAHRISLERSELVSGIDSKDHPLLTMIRLTTVDPHRVSIFDDELGGREGAGVVIRDRNTVMQKEL